MANPDRIVAGLVLVLSLGVTVAFIYLFYPDMVTEPHSEEEAPKFVFALKATFLFSVQHFIDVFASAFNFYQN
jgi:hypothetical protein